jgi:hypothetical protein
MSRVLAKRTDEDYLKDIRAGSEYLKTHESVKLGGVGFMGFCSSFALGWNDRMGWNSIIEKEGRWESAFGTVTVRYLHDKVVEKSFTPIALGIKTLCKVRTSMLGIQNMILRFRPLRFEGKLLSVSRRIVASPHRRIGWKT